MSYILDALKKAEADRDPDARTKLAIEQGDRRRYRLLGYFVIAALLANALIMVWLFMPDSDSPAQMSPASATATATPPVVPKPTVAPKSAVTPKTGPPADAAGVAAEVQIRGERRRRSSLAGLPDTVRNRFPTLAFSTHIFAADPTLRAVVVNGSRLQEGDQLAGLTVHEITEAGAVFSFEQYLVAVPILESWE